MVKKWLLRVEVFVMSLIATKGKKAFDNEQLTWSVSNSPRRSHGGGGGGGGVAGWLIGLITILFLAFVAMNLISAFAPSIGNLTYTGGGVGATIFTLVQDWILPLGLVGLLIWVVKHFLGGKGR